MLYGWKENSMLTNCLAACAHLTITVSEIERDICEKIVILSYPLHSTPPLGEFPSEYRHPLWYEKTRMVWLPWCKKFEYMFIRFDVIHERDRRTDRQTLHDSKDRAYASHRAVISAVIIQINQDFTFWATLCCFLSIYAKQRWDNYIIRVILILRKYFWIYLA